MRVLIREGCETSAVGSVPCFLGVYVYMFSVLGAVGAIHCGSPVSVLLTAPSLYFYNETTRMFYDLQWFGWCFCRDSRQERTKDRPPRRAAPMEVLMMWNSKC